jgi:outer membrane immunogenic protein
VKGGAAVTDRQFDYINNATSLVTASTGFATRWAGTVGAGLEYGFAPNWSAAVEYDHIFEGKHDVVFTTPGGIAITGRTSGGDTDLITARINYHWGAPVVARY